MKYIKKILIEVLIFIFIFMSFFINYVEAATITKENLDTALQGLKALATDNEVKYDVTVNDDTISINVNGTQYTLKYDLSDKPTFYAEIPIEQGMSYEEFKTQTQNLIAPLIGYIAVANIQGISYEDAVSYFLMYIFDQIMGGLSSNSSKYIIVEQADGVDVQENTGKEIIYASEFGEHVMEYVNDVYKNGSVVTDSNGINSFEWKTEQKDVTDSSCKLVSTISINLNSDFSKLSQNVDENKPTSPEQNPPIQQEEKTPTNSNTSQKQQKEQNLANKILPKTGMKSAIILCTILSIISIIAFIQFYKYRDIK